MFIHCRDWSSIDLYKILIGSIVPRPIAWVSTRNTSGINNLAPFSFFNCFGADPPMVGFAPAFKSIEKTSGGIVRVPKDTLQNVRDTGEFVVNLVGRDLAEKMNATSAEFAPEVSEFDAVGIATAPSQLVAPPRVADALVNFECKLIQVVEHGNNNLVLGEIVGIRLDERVLNDRGHIRADVLQAVGRMAGSWYTTTNDRFELKRPNLES